MGRASAWLALVAGTSLLAAPAGAEVASDCPQDNDVLARLSRSLDQLDERIAAAPELRFGNVGFATTLRADTIHDYWIEKRGCGRFMGAKNRSSETPETGPGVNRLDCTTFVLHALREAFAAQGRREDWKRVMARAQRISRRIGPGGFKGLGLMRALVDELGWKGVYWAPDSENPADEDAEHSYTARVARREGTYYDLPVEEVVTDYRPTDPEQPPNREGMDKLRNVPFAVLAARGGTHMALLVYGTVYEVHWTYGCHAPTLIEGRDLEQEWPWLSGAVVIPPEAKERAWSETPTYFWP